MAGKHILPAKKVEALTLRSAGWTLTLISDRTGISVSSLKRLFEKHGVPRGELKDKAVQEATQALINDANAIDKIKREVAALILDDIALAKRLRQVMAEATDQLIATDTIEALQVMRAVSAGAVALKSTSETLRKSLGIDKNDELNEEIPELRITVMTEGEIQTIKQEARSRTFGVDDGLGGTLYNGARYDDEVVEFTNDDEYANDAIS